MEFTLFMLRWLHFLAGITWIGILYYFNFVQTPFFAETEATVRTGAIQKLVPRALWWFRWGAMFTFLAGIAIYILRMGEMGGGLFYSSSYGVTITVGGLMGTLMFLNVWLIIWPNQKIMIASNQQIKGGGQALPEAAAAAPKAGLASRTNVMFSIPMLFFMGASAHFAHGGLTADKQLALIVALVIIAALELNAIFGKQGPLVTVRGVIVSGLALTVVLWAVVQLL